MDSAKETLFQGASDGAKERPHLFTGWIQAVTIVPSGPFPKRMFSPPRQHFVSFYALLIMGWCVLFLAGMGFVVDRSLAQVEKDFQRETEQAVAALRDRLRANEALLAGFAVFLGANTNNDRVVAQRYAQAVLNLYPHVYMLEVAQRVGREERSAFEARAAKRGLPGHGLHAFGDDDRRRPMSAKAEYFPLVLIAPDLPALQPTYGLDVDSVPHLRIALRETLSWRKAVSSEPFALPENGLAYALLQAVDQLRQDPVAESQVALLLVRSESLRPLGLGEQYAYSAKIMRSDAPGNPPPLFAQAAAPAGLLAGVLPRYRTEMPEFSSAQPIQLEISRQVRWSDIALDDVARVAALALSALALLWYYIRQHRGATYDARTSFDRPEYKALHDSLTELPNRALMADRVEQAVNRWHRRKVSFSLLMIDLDRFKKINDRFRHEGGDRVLELIAHRLAAALRACDTVARFGSDEFIVLLSDTQNEPVALAVAEKLRMAVAEPIAFRGQQIHVTCSIGVATCPHDGDSYETLLRQADLAMYRVKSKGRNGVSAVVEKEL
jgi:diguanylate cyclase